MAKSRVIIEAEENLTSQKIYFGNNAYDVTYIDATTESSDIVPLVRPDTLVAPQWLGRVTIDSFLEDW